MIRIAVDGDRDAIQRLVNEAFAVERRIKKGGGERLDASGEELGRLMAAGIFLVLDEDGSLAASVYLEPRGVRCYLGLLSVARARQGAGLARRMTAAAEMYARDIGCTWMDLRVVTPRRGELVPLYTKLGYAEVGTQGYPEPLAALMEEPGHFILMAKQIAADADRAV